MQATSILARSQKTGSAEDFAEAMREFQKELESDPTNANAAYEIGEADRRAGERDPAQQFFEQALKSCPDFAEARLGLAAVLSAEGKAADALAHQKAIVVDPGNEVACYRLSQVRRKLGNTAEQEKALAGFRELHHKANQQNLVENILSPREVTKPELDPNAQWTLKESPPRPGTARRAGTRMAGWTSTAQRQLPIMEAIRLPPKTLLT